MELRRIFNIHDVYNELFRALAWDGRDEEFLSLWQEAKSCLSRYIERKLMVVGARFTWHSYVYLFRCFTRAPKLRIREAIEAYNEFQHKRGPNPVRPKAVRRPFGFRANFRSSQIRYWFSSCVASLRVS